MDILNNIKNLKNNIRYCVAFISTFVVGLIAHSFMIFNKISFFDDITMIDLHSPSAAIVQGRYFWGLLLKINDVLFGNFSSPVLCGFLTILFIAMANIIIVKILDIKNFLSIILLSSVIILSTGTITLFAYMYASIYYSFAILLAVLSPFFYIELDKKELNKLKVLVSAIFLVLAMSIAQNYFLFGVIVFLYYVIVELNYKKNSNFKFYIGYILSVILSIFIYVLFTKFFFLVINKIIDFFELNIPKLYLTGYQGLNNINSFTFVSFDGIKRIFYHILSPDQLVYDKLIYIYYIILFIILCYNIYIFINRKYSFDKKVTIAISCIGIVIVINCIYILEPITYIYTLTLHQKSLIFLFPIILLELCDIKHKSIVCVLIIYYALYSITLANTLYTKRYMKQQIEIRWLTTFITRLQSTNGFNADKEVYIYNNDEPKIQDKTYDSSFMSNELYPYQSDSRIHYNLYGYMLKWLGFNSGRFHYNDMSQDLDLVRSMTNYPDDGCIKVVNDKIYVRLTFKK